MVSLGVEPLTGLSQGQDPPDWSLLRLGPLTGLCNGGILDGFLTSVGNLVSLKGWTVVGL